MHKYLQLEGSDKKLTCFTRIVLSQSKVFKRMLEGNVFFFILNL